MIQSVSNIVFKVLAIDKESYRQTFDGIRDTFYVCLTGCFVLSWNLKKNRIVWRDFLRIELSGILTSQRFSFEINIICVGED